jgi:hypothetical protein
MIAGVTERAVRLDPSLDEAQVTVAMTQLDSVWEKLFPAEQQRIVRLLIEEVIVSPNDPGGAVPAEQNRSAGAGAAAGACRRNR